MGRGSSFYSQPKLPGEGTDILVEIRLVPIGTGYAGRHNSNFKFKLIPRLMCSDSVTFISINVIDYRPVRGQGGFPSKGEECRSARVSCQLAPVSICHVSAPPTADNLLAVISSSSFQSMMFLSNLRPLWCQCWSAQPGAD